MEGLTERLGRARGKAIYDAIRWPAGREAIGSAPLGNSARLRTSAISARNNI
jgi:hypothetical protein